MKREQHLGNTTSRRPNGKAKGLLLILVGLVGSVALSTGLSVAETQNDQIGFSPNHIFDGSLKGENIDVMTGNVTLRFPIGPRLMLNDWFGYQIQLYYNSKLWQHKCDPADSPRCYGRLMASDTYGLGFQIHFGRIYHDPQDNPNIYRYQTSDGAEHMFCWDNPAQPWETCTVNSQSLNNWTFDSSSFYVERVSSSWTVYPGDGTKIKFGHCTSQTYDPSNPPYNRPWGGCYATRIETLAREPEPSVEPQEFVNINYASGGLDSIDSITDSAGRTIDFWAPAGGGQRISLPCTGCTDGQTADYDLIRGSLSFYDPEYYTDDGAVTPTPISKQVLQEIRLPMISGTPNLKHLFGYGTEPIKFGYLKKWTLPTGAVVDYYYRHYRTSDARPYHVEMSYKTLTMTVDGQPQTSRWSYARFGDGAIWDFDDWQASQDGELFQGSNAFKVHVLDPFDNLTVYWFHHTEFGPGDCLAGTCRSSWSDGLLAAVEVYAGPTENSSRLVTRDFTTHTYDGARATIEDAPVSGYDTMAALNVRPAAAERFTFGGGDHSTTHSRTVYDDWTNLVNGTIRLGEPAKARRVREYDGNLLYRTTFTNFLGSGSLKDFHDLHDYTEIRNNLGATLSRTDRRFSLNRLRCEVRRMQLDGSYPSVASDCSNLFLEAGDVGVKNVYDAQGNLESSTISGGDVPGAPSVETHYTYENGALETKMLGSYAWKAIDRTADPGTGLVTASRDSAGAQVGYAWDALGRLTEIEPSGPERSTIINYPNIHLTWVTQQGSDTANSIESKFHYDQLGRVIKEERRNLQGTFDFRKTKYDIAGRVTKQSEWTAPAAPEPPDSQLAWTVYEYSYLNTSPQPGEPAVWTDPLGRVSRVTRPDLGTTDTEYEGLATVVTVHGIQGPTGLQDATTTYLNDSFGRLVSVDSPGNGADAAYLYDERDNLKKVTLTDPAPSGFSQVRQFGYDGLGRLRFATNPENGTVEYLTYDARGNLLKHQDARAKLFINSYDVAGRLTSKALSIAGATPSCTGGEAPASGCLLANKYDDYLPDAVPAGAGPSSGKLTKQWSYRFNAQQGTSSHVATKTLAYGTSTTCAPFPAATTYGGLNGRLHWSKMKIPPGAELQTSYCQDEMGLPYGVEYPDTERVNDFETPTVDIY